MFPKEKNTNVSGKKIVWVSFLILDLWLHKTSRIEIMEHLAKRGYTVHLIAVRSRKECKLRNSSIHVVSIPLRYIPIFSPILFVGVLLVFLPYYIISLRPDFIVTEPNISIFGLMWVPLLSRFRRFKVVLDIRSTPVETVGLRGCLQTFCFDASIFIAEKLFDGITIITTLMRKEICNKFRIDSKIVGVWTSGVSPTLFDPEKIDKEGIELRKKFGLTGKFVIFHHGNFGFKRGIIETIESFKILKNSYHDLVLFLLGTGPALPEMEKVIEEDGIQDRVLIHSPVDYADVPKYVAMCDIGIVPLPDLPDWRHQCPLKLLEYLSMKKVVVITDIPAHREVVGKSKCGIYISTVDAMEIARAITYAYKNKERLKQTGSCGRAIVNRKYSWKKVAEAFDNYLTRLKSGSQEKRTIVLSRQYGYNSKARA